MAGLFPIDLRSVTVSLGVELGWVAVRQSDAPADGAVVDQTSMMSLVWSTTGPLLAKHADATDGACAGCGGLALVDLATGVERQVLAPSAGTIGPSSTSVLDVLVVWVTRCLGLFDTVCSSSLLRIDLLDATVQTVAVSSQPGPVALSWDARRVAFGAPDGIHVKPLP